MDHAEAQGSPITWSNVMKKDDPNAVESPTISESKALTITERSRVAERPEKVRRRHAQLVPVSKIFSVRPDADLLTLMAHASQNLASLSVMTLDLVNDPQGPQRSRAVAIHQLTGLTEMLVSSALIKLDPSQSAEEEKPFRCH
ncbi:DUF6124 family protein [Pseudomonas sp. B2M1-30]|uniref:DUF6124 family protein n=1 Tax=Pseudomonas TaxID=286 RepID=UPI0021C6116D|nr:MULTISPECIES: DUF6124 family protein [Pseudomonas]MCU0119831.1 DUF6124 family protein [Pseudomonas sp. B2M1-30]MCU7261673.1 DUF6124 family protein [Pseudomonas koreensis]